MKSIIDLFLGLILCLNLLNLNTPISGKRGPAENQLENWRKTHKTKHFATTQHYTHVPDLTSTVGIGQKGPLLLQDTQFQFQLSAFTNERIPERVVHAKGAGAKGYFIVTNSMAKWTKAKLFNKVGKRTPVVVRFSTVAGNLGAPDTIIDQRGFAVKFKTEEGNYDLLTLNILSFPVRDPMIFPAVSRSRARNPATHLLDPDMNFDFAALRPESTFNVFQLHTNLGYFESYRHMQGHSINSFMWVGGTETSKEPVFVRYHLIPTEKTKLSSIEEFRKHTVDPDYMLRRLYNDIGEKKYPTYHLFVQKFTMEDVKKAKFNLFDATKILFEKEYPMIKIGKLILNENPKDYFNDVEQVAFNVGNLVPGIQISPDRLLHGRPFAYTHTQIHRLGINHQQLPINRPAKGIKGHSYLRDGFMNIDGNDDGGPNFFPNSFNGPYVDPDARRVPTEVEGGIVDSVDVNAFDKDYYSQFDRYWREIMGPAERKKTIESLAQALAPASKETQQRSLKHNWDPVNAEIRTMMRAALAKENAKLTKVKRRANNRKQRRRKTKITTSKMGVKKEE